MKLSYDALVHAYRSPSGEARQVLDIANWDIEPSQQILLRGVSGSGKTTLFNITAGLLAPTEGQVVFDDKFILNELSERKRDRFRATYVGYVFQNHYLLPALTALDNVIMPMAFAKILPRPQWRNRATELLEKVGLDDHISYRPAQLSTGQRLRVGVARALANYPKIVLADEPTASLDESSADEVMDLIQETCRELNAILMVSSHDPALMSRFETIANLHAGRVSFEEKALA